VSGLRRALADLRTAVTMPGVQIVLSRGEPDDTTSCCTGSGARIPA
jgi:hypothetical protein